MSWISGSCSDASTNLFSEPPDGTVIVDLRDLVVTLFDDGDGPVLRIGDGVTALDIMPGIGDSAAGVGSAVMLRSIVADFATAVARMPITHPH